MGGGVADLLREQQEKLTFTAQPQSVSYRAHASARLGLRRRCRIRVWRRDDAEGTATGPRGPVDGGGLQGEDAVKPAGGTDPDQSTRQQGDGCFEGHRRWRANTPRKLEANLICTQRTKRGGNEQGGFTVFYPRWRRGSC